MDPETPLKITLEKKNRKEGKQLQIFDDLPYQIDNSHHDIYDIIDLKDSVKEQTFLKSLLGKGINLSFYFFPDPLN